tara:strand:- start:1744 stop:1917 length:174 start_codon:yes stop_codon:yes gene_type:complete
MVTMKEYRLCASRVTNYVAFVEAESKEEAENIALTDAIDWQFIDDDDYEIYTIEEAE